MGISIKDDHTDHLAREVAKQTGESLTQAIRVSLEERLQRLSGRRRAPTQLEKLHEILNRLDNMPRIDRRSEDEILGYDEHGIPR